MPPQCPLCLRHTPTLVCVECQHDETELVRNSVVDNDRHNALMKTQIDRVFEVTRLLRHNPDNVDYQENHPLLLSVKQVTLQLLKLEIINATLKLRNIDRTKNAMAAKVARNTERRNTLRTLLQQQRETLNAKNIDMKQHYAEKHQLLLLQTTEINREKNVHVAAQSLRLQSERFKVLKDVVFERKPQKTNLLSSRLMRGGRAPLMFHHQPILVISDLLNHKLVTINEFLENLIRLQGHLHEILSIGSEFSLPYLDELQGYLPDRKFYQLVQDKEDFIYFGDTHSPEESSEEKAPAISIKEIGNDNERIIKLGEAIKLPLLSKTINNQLRKASVSQSPKSPSMSPPLEEKPKESRPSIVPRTSLRGRKVVIVPHKILTKPFTKLSAKEFLKFLSIIVKILVNFRSIFSLTSDKRLKRKSSLSTIESRRAGPAYDYDFQTILTRVESLGEYFEAKLQKLRSQEDDLGRTTPLRISVNSSVSTPSLTTASTSLVNISEPGPSKSPLENLYSRFKTPKPPPLDDVYGLISETSDPESDDEPETDLMAITHHVYRLMESGSNKRHTLDSKALTMMAQSKVQLDDWDVVSKMY